MTPRIQTRQAWRCGVVVWMVCVLVGSVAFAQDGVKLSGLWVEPVTVYGIEGGQVRYQVASGRVLNRPIQNLEGLKLGRYPDLAKAEQLLDRGEDAEAAAALRGVMAGAREDWVRWFSGKQLVTIYSRLDDADPASAIYIDMVISGADLGYIAEPPVDVLARADVAVRQRVSELAATAKNTVGPDRAALLDKLIDASGQPGGVALPVTGPGDAGGAGAPAGGLVLSASAPPGTAVNLFRQGDYLRMLTVADEALTQPGKTAAELYLKGMAQLALAEQADEDAGGESGGAGGEGLYKSAGLSFMRVLVYFPRSAVAGPATLEAGYVHEKIGRADIAQRLYDRAGPLIDPREDPVYFQRLSQRREAVAEAITGE